MKLLADENVDRPIVARLRADGHSVIYILELAPDMSDPEENEGLPRFLVGSVSMVFGPWRGNPGNADRNPALDHRAT